MSEVNADGVLLDPHEAILQEAQNLTNSLLAERPQGLEEDSEHPVLAGNGAEAGQAGGAPHMSVSAALAAPEHKGAGSGSYAAQQPRKGTRRSTQQAGPKHPNRLPPNRRSLQSRQLTGGNRTWQIRTRWVWWRPRDWWEPLRPPTPW